MSISLYAETPSFDAKRIAELRGHVEGEVAGKVKQATVTPLADWIERRIALVDADNMEINFRDLKDNEITIAYDPDLQNIIKDFVCYNATGAIIHHRARGSGSSGSERHRTIRFDSKPHSIGILLYTEVKQHQIPFIARDIPLPHVPKNDTEKGEPVLLKAEDIVEKAEVASGTELKLEGVEAIETIIPEF